MGWLTLQKRTGPGRQASPHARFPAHPPLRPHPPGPPPAVYSGKVSHYPRGQYRVMVYALAWTAFSLTVVELLQGLAVIK